MKKKKKVRRKRTLLVATTVYQVIVAIQMKRMILKKQDVDIILGDETPNMERICESLLQTGLFEEVYFVRMNDYNKGIGEYYGYSSVQYVMYQWRDIRRMFRLEKKYDMYFVPFFHPFHMNLYSYIKRFSNPYIKAYLYEEGSAIYSAMGKLYQKLIETYDSMGYKVFGYSRMLKEICGVVVFHPELMQWGKEYRKIRLPLLRKSDKEIKRICNIVFHYHGEFAQDYSKKVVFLEEAKYQDGIWINDVGIVEEIMDMVGKENILVKRHPRAEQNRFERIGCATNQDMLIPWEVIYMNHDFTDKIIISTASSSIMHPMLLFGEEVKAVYLFKMVHAVLPSELQCQEEFIEKVVGRKYKDCFFFPSNMDDLRQIFSENNR